MTYAEGKSGNPIVLLGKASEKEAPWPGRTSGVVTCCSLMTRAERSIGRENDRNGYSPIPFNASKGVRLALTLFLNIFIPLAFTRKHFAFFFLFFRFVLFPIVDLCERVCIHRVPPDTFFPLLLRQVEAHAGETVFTCWTNDCEKRALIQ